MLLSLDLIQNFVVYLQVSLLLKKGYKVTLIEDATGTANDEEVYEMPGLDIKGLRWINLELVQCN